MEYTDRYVYTYRQDDLIAQQTAKTKEHSEETKSNWLELEVSVASYEAI